MKLLLILIMVLSLTGCGKTELEKKQDYVKEHFYEIFSQYNIVEDGIYIVSANEKYGLMNSNDGTIYQEVEYDKMQKIDGDNVLAAKDYKYVIMSKTGKVKKELGYYDNIRAYHNGEAPRLLTYSDGYYTLLDGTGELITDFGQFDHLALDTALNDRFVIQRGTLFTIINEQGNQISNLGRYDELIPDFENGKFIGVKGNKKGIIKDNGVTVVQFACDDIWKAEKNGLYVLVQGNLMGVADKDGKIIIPVKYAGIDSYQKVFVIKDGDKYGFCDLEGNFLTECEYDGVSDIKSDKESFTCTVQKDGEFFNLSL